MADRVTAIGVEAFQSPATGKVRVTALGVEAYWTPVPGHVRVTAIGVEAFWTPAASVVASRPRRFGAAA